MEKNINIKGSLLDLSTPVVMGILNVTPDSFFSESRKQTETDIVNRCRQILDEGGGIIDIGGQSTTPTSTLLTAKEEMERLSPALKIIRREFPEAVCRSIHFTPMWQNNRLRSSAWISSTIFLADKSMSKCFL